MDFPLEPEVQYRRSALTGPLRESVRAWLKPSREQDVIQNEPIPQDVPWLVFINVDKGYGYGFVMLESRATKLVNAGTGISDGVNNGKYWSRRLIGGADTPLSPGDQFEERSAYVLFRSSKEKPLEDFFKWEKQIRGQFARSSR